ncbi:MAG: transketolase [Candidatus Vogelbacteria bacterium CG10_big_fil_rev_8_21_14_0_10_51_16]|uniref:Transketolase n=1 Tax=Candidatus Vogelbacteria bacterium CG10_big_fil_rev_8_21_14_0_10_51_16 TaxID=1975045 RepID=A0A2H0RDA6_9BACT|nr:MAG: transketolase [Candidatus Vogelbacteria bacterium CG10_big_fil_rev_8_21_14_0_10_51_16]
MLNHTQKPNPKLFDIDVDQRPIRAGFGEGLLQAGKDDYRVVALCADLTESTKMDAFADEFPERFVEVGVAEQNLVTVASGMAAMGKIPFCSSYAMFSPGRNWEQIRTTIAYNNANVKVVGSHAGVSVGPDGGTHQALEDIALMRVLPRMTVVAPCDAIEARKATLALAKHVGPAYLRLAREKTPAITTLDTPFELGRSNLLVDAEHPSVALVVCGSLTYQALLAARQLAQEGIEALVLNLHTIKPLDREAVLDVARRAGRVVTIEEHQVAGGMGSAVAEFLAENFPVPVRFIGVRDQFGQSGTPDELIAHYGLDAKAILAVAKGF